MATTWKYGGYCACGCGQKTQLAPYDHKTHDRRKGEPYEYVFEHHNNQRRSDYVVDEATGCHVWQGQPSQRYPSIKVKGQPKYVHVWFWEQANGPIPAGMVLHHTCENPRCCNVEHLEVVTQATNAHYGRGSKLTMDKANQIRGLYRQGGYTHQELAEMFGVSKTSIENVIYGKTWQPVELHRPAPPRRGDAA